MAIARERELEAALRQRDADLDAHHADAQEHQQLLSKARAAIEQLQQEVTQGRTEGEAQHAAARQASEDHAAQLQHAEDIVSQLDLKLAASTSSTQELQAQVAKLQAELNGVRAELEGQVASAQQKVKERERRIAGLTEEAQALGGQVQGLERALKERKDKVLKLEAQAQEAQKLQRDTEANVKKLHEQNQELQQQVNDANRALEQQKQHARDLQLAVERGERDRAEKEREWAHRLEREQAQWGSERSGSELKTREEVARQQSRLEATEREWMRRAHEVELHWERRLKDGMAACERKFDEEAAEWQARLDEVERSWQARAAELEELWRTRVEDERRMMELERVQWAGQRAAVKMELEAAWGERLAALQAKLTEQLEAAQSAANKESEALKEAGQARLREAELSCAQRLEAVESAWARKLEEAKRRWATERAAREEEWAVGKSEMEAALTEVVSKREAELAIAHRRELEALQQQCTQEKEALQQQCTQEKEALQASLQASFQVQLSTAKAEALQKHRSMQEDLEGRLSSLTLRLTELSARDASRETARQSMARQLDESRSALAEEVRRRREAEAGQRGATEATVAGAQQVAREAEAAARELRNQQLQARLAAVSQSAALASPSLASSAAATTATALAQASRLHVPLAEPSFGEGVAPLSLGPISTSGKGSLRGGELGALRRADGAAAPGSWAAGVPPSSQPKPLYGSAAASTGPTGPTGVLGAWEALAVRAEGFRGFSSPAAPRDATAVYSPSTLTTTTSAAWRQKDSSQAVPTVGRSYSPAASLPSTSPTAVVSPHLPYTQRLSLERSHQGGASSSPTQGSPSALAALGMPATAAGPATSATAASWRQLLSRSGGAASASAGSPGIVPDATAPVAASSPAWHRASTPPRSPSSQAEAADQQLQEARSTLSLLALDPFQTSVVASTTSTAWPQHSSEGIVGSGWRDSAARGWEVPHAADTVRTATTSYHTASSSWGRAGGGREERSASDAGASGGPSVPAQAGAGAGLSSDLVKGALGTAALPEGAVGAPVAPGPSDQGTSQFASSGAREDPAQALQASRELLERIRNLQDSTARRFGQGQHADEGRTGQRGMDHGDKLAQTP